MCQADKMVVNYPELGYFGHLIWRISTQTSAVECFVTLCSHRQINHHFLGQTWFDND